MSQVILVTGAAGYIGSVIVEKLLDKGYEVIGLDNLVTGHRGAVSAGAKFILGDVTSDQDLEAAFGQYEIGAVIHLAAKTLVNESVSDPLPYFETNMAGGLRLVQAMLRHKVNKIVFSSTAAVYGEPEMVPIDEDHPCRPLNPYGESKLAFERVLKWLSTAYGLECAVFRYFNAAGATELYGEDHFPETHLIPLVLRVALDTDKEIKIFGNDYETPDGTCIRDYVHVSDLADAHILALQESGNEDGWRVFNIGNGDGYSVAEVVEAARRVTGQPIPALNAERRPGDPARLVASSSRAVKELGWVPEHPGLEVIIESAFRWHLAHLGGYNTK